MNKIEILPAIIPESFEDLKDKMSLVKGVVSIVQVDICDGIFVPSKSWPYVGDEEEDFQKIIEEDEGFPFWENLDFEADLMIKITEEKAEEWIKAGAKRIILHEESSGDVLNIVKNLRKKYGYSSDSAVSVEIGVAINPDTPNEVLDRYLNTEKPLADFVQFMGIERIGYQGQEFDEEVLEKIRDFREKYPEVLISVDGGVGFDNAGDLKEAGANRLISGSAVYESDDMKEAIEELKKI